MLWENYITTKNILTGKSQSENLEVGLIKKYTGYISKEDVVFDFGCGGGFLLKNIECKKKIGVEINKSICGVNGS